MDLALNNLQSWYDIKPNQTKPNQTKPNLNCLSNQDVYIFYWTVKHSCVLIYKKKQKNKNAFHTPEH